MAIIGEVKDAAIIGKFTLPVKDFISKCSVFKQISQCKIVVVLRCGQ